jgi:Polyketide cyclase / dehydrase and lipid transport
VVVISSSAESAADVDTVWALVADHRGYASWGPWQQARLEREGTPSPDGVGAVRILRARPLTMREEVVTFEPPSRLDYVLHSGLPLRDYRASVTLTPSGQGTTLHWRAEFEPKIPGTGWFYRWFLDRVFDDVTERAARGAEGRGAP